MNNIEVLYTQKSSTRWLSLQPWHFKKWALERRLPLSPLSSKEKNLIHSLERKIERNPLFSCANTHGGRNWVDEFYDNHRDFKVFIICKSIHEHLDRKFELSNYKFLFYIGFFEAIVFYCNRSREAWDRCMYLMRSNIREQSNLELLPPTCFRGGGSLLG